MVLLVFPLKLVIFFMAYLIYIFCKTSFISSSFFFFLGMNQNTKDTKHQLREGWHLSKLSVYFFKETLKKKENKWKSEVYF